MARKQAQGSLGEGLKIFRPLGWMAGFAIVAALVLVVLLDAKPERPTFVPFIPAKFEKLVPNEDYWVTSWFGDEAEANNPDQGFQPVHLIQVKVREEGLRFSSKFLLQFGFPLNWDADEAAGREFVVAAFDERLGRWERVTAKLEGRKEVVMSAYGANPGFYALGTFSTTAPVVQPEGKSGGAASPTVPEAPTGAESKPLPSTTPRFTPVLRLLEGRKPEVRTGFQLAVFGTTEADRGQFVAPVESEIVLALAGDASGEPYMTRTCEVRWYLSTEDRRADFPHQVKLVTEAGAYEFRDFPGYRPGQYDVWVVITNAVDGQELAEAHVIITIERNAPTG